MSPSRRLLAFGARSAAGVRIVVSRPRAVLAAVTVFLLGGLPVHSAAPPHGQATAARRTFTRTLRLHGVVEPVKSHTVAAPRLAGPSMGPMVITRLAPPGTRVKQGELLVEFDRQAQLKTALDRRAEYLDLVEQIKKKQAEQSAARAKDQTELRQAENAAESARLELRKNEVVSRIDAEKNQQAHEEAAARLAQLRDTFELKRRAAQAELRILEIQRDRAYSAMRHAEQNTSRLSIASGIDGLVVLNAIWKGNSMSEVGEGDEVRPGVPFMQVVNPEAMQVRARINQADRADLEPGQKVTIHLDAYPEVSLPGRVGTIAAIGVASSLSQKVRSFVGTITIEGSDAKLMPDLSAAVDVELESRPGVLVIPRDALLRDADGPFVRVPAGGGSSRRAVRVGAMSDQEVVVESGLEEGAVVLRGTARPEERR
jgi:HlyD family secretion protein